MAKKACEVKILKKLVNISKASPFQSLKMFISVSVLRTCSIAFLFLIYLEQRVAIFLLELFHEGSEKVISCSWSLIAIFSDKTKTPPSPNDAQTFAISSSLSLGETN